ncbi:MAG: hypothetical protein K2X28_05655 [Alphaproteobacteria bacterium]|nr:hypothetical protein [Alphaproteobacteria bacterium]
MSVTIFWTFAPYTEALGAKGSSKLRSKKSCHQMIKGNRPSHQSKKPLPAEIVFGGSNFNWENPNTYILLGLMVSTGMIGTCQAIQSGSTPLRTNHRALNQNSTSLSNSSYTLASQPPNSSMTRIPELCSKTELCFVPPEVCKVNYTGEAISQAASPPDSFNLSSRPYTLAPQPSSNCTIEATSPPSSWSEAELCFVHPGVCALPTTYTDEDAINQSALEILEESTAQMQAEMETGDFSSLVPLFQERFRVGVVDGELLPSPILQTAAEAIRWRESLKYVDEEIIPTPIEETSFKIFEKHLFRVNSILIGNSSENTYRSNPMLIAKLPISSPRFQHTERMKDFLADHPLHLATYNALIPKVDKIIQGLVSEGLIQNDDEGKKDAWEEVVTAIFKKNPSFYTPERYSLCMEYYDFDHSPQKVLQTKMKVGYKKVVSLLQEGKTFEAGTALHQTIVGTHVCPDANGRTARAFVLGLLKQKNLPRPVFWSDEAYTVYEFSTYETQEAIG